jgi:hypothetical protein
MGVGYLYDPGKMERRISHLLFTFRDKGPVRMMVELIQCHNST